jgi:hypothetical protein
MTTVARARYAGYRFPAGIMESMTFYGVRTLLSGIWR